MEDPQKTHPMETLLRPKNDRPLSVLTILEHSGDLVPHLHELRKRLTVAAIVFVLASLAGWALGPSIIHYFQDSVGRLMFIAPAEAFFVRIKIAAVFGMLLSAPIAVVQLWRFIVPGLLTAEKRAARAFLWLGGLLFPCGLLFGYYLVYPVALDFFLGFGTDQLQPAIVVSRFLGFFLGTTVSFGVAFQLPTVLLILVRAGLMRADQLRAARRPAILLAFIAGALLTPADVVSQFMMAIPLIVLYEGAVWLAPRFDKKQLTADAADDLEGITTDA